MVTHPAASETSPQLTFAVAPRRAGLIAVVLMHLFAVWALLTLGSVQRVVKAPLALSVSLIASPKTEPPPEPPRPLPNRLMAMREVSRIEIPPVILTEIPITQTAPAITVQPVAAAPPQPPVVVAPSPSPATVLEPPRFDLAYLNNPAPAYPPVSRRLREQGRVLLRVRVTVDGRAEAVEVKTSSGSARLDAAAAEAVRLWRFTPARQGGEPIAGYALVPIDFELTG
jgi:protein TonB